MCEENQGRAALAWMRHQAQAIKPETPDDACVTIYATIIIEALETVPPAPPKRADLGKKLRTLNCSAGKF